MKKIFKGLFVVLSFVMVICGMRSVTYAASDNEKTTTISSEEATKEETTEKQEEPISDGKMILTMLLGMITIASIIVIFAAVNYKKTMISEKGHKRDVF